MKRTLCALLLLLLLLALPACGSQLPPESTTAETTTEALTTEAPQTTAPPPTLLPVDVERHWWPGFGWDSWIESFPIFLEPAQDYYELLDHYRQVRAGGSINGSFGISVMLHDFDGDFIPELIVVLTGNPGREWHVYTLRNGKTHWVGSFGGTFRSALYSCSKGGIYLDQLDSGVTGAGTVTWVKKKGDQLTESEVASWKTGFEKTWELPSDSVELMAKELGDYDWTY